MEENNDILLAGGDALDYLAGSMHKKNIPQHLLGTSILYVRILRPIFQPPPPLYAFRITVTAVGLFQMILLNTIGHIF